MPAHAGVRLVDHRLAGAVKGGSPEKHVVLPSVSGPLAGTFLFGRLDLGLCGVRCRLLLQIGEPHSVGPPGEVPALSFSSIPAHPRGDDWLVVSESRVQLGLVQLYQDVAIPVPDLLDAPEAADGNDVAEGPHHPGDPDIVPTGREVHAPDHLRLTDLRYPSVVHTDQNQLARGMPLQESLVEGCGHEAGVGPKDVFPVLGDVDLGPLGQSRRNRHSWPVIGDDHGADELTILGPLE